MAKVEKMAKAEKTEKTELKPIRIRLKKSLIGSSESQRRVATGLGLRKINQVVEHFNSPTILGMVNKIPHLVEIVD
jgi:large subunit ribosomal protein L30